MLLESIDQTRHEVSPTLDPKRRSKLGQFMTPGRIASFMAGMFDALPHEVRILDAGAGMGALTAAFVAEALGREVRPTSIDVTCYEVDDQLASILDGTLAVRRASARVSLEVAQPCHVVVPSACNPSTIRFGAPYCQTARASIAVSAAL